MIDAVDHLEKLEAKILKAADLLRKAQAEKHALLDQLAKVRAELEKHAKSSGGWERERLALRREREEVRSRVEKLLRQIDILTKSAPGA